jgi:hypothetical protein
MRVQVACVSWSVPLIAKAELGDGAHGDGKGETCKGTDIMVPDAAGIVDSDAKFS